MKLHRKLYMQSSLIQYWSCESVNEEYNENYTYIFEFLCRAEIVGHEQLNT